MGLESTAVPVEAEGVGLLVECSNLDMVDGRIGDRTEKRWRHRSR